MRESYYDALYMAESSHWWYRVRRQMIHFLLKKYVAKSGQTIKILDVGCGSGVLMGELARYGSVSGIDFSPKAVSYAKQRGITDVFEGRAESVPFPSGSFDVVLALDVIEHVEDDGAALREIKRVVKPGGLVIIFVPAFMMLWGITDEVSHHFRRYTKGELARKLGQVDLKIVRAFYFNTFLFLPILVVRTLGRLLPSKFKPENETDMSGGMMNDILYSIFRLESKLLEYADLPFGVSLALIARKQS